MGDQQKHIPRSAAGAGGDTGSGKMPSPIGEGSALRALSASSTLSAWAASGRTDRAGAPCRNC